MTEWISKPLGEVTSLMSKGIAPAYVDIEGDSTVRVLNQKCNRDYRISYEESRINDLTKKSVPDERFLQPGDVLINSTGTGTAGRIAQIWDIPCQTTIDGHMILIRPSSNLDPLYFGYALKQCQSQVELLAEGSTGQTEINRKRLCNEVIITFPESISKQKEVASILSSIDDKIELNERINHNLAEQSQAMYAEMFGVPSSDCSNGVLSDISEITMGQSPDRKSYNEDGIGTVFFQGRAEFGDRFPTKRLFTTEPKRMARENDVLMSVRAPVGDLNVAHEDCCIGRGLGAIRSKDNHQSFVFYTLLSLRPQLNVFNGEGTVFGSINRDALNSMPIILPPQNGIDHFEKIVAPMDAAIRCNYDEIVRLQQIRDSLLPKLMSGELDVSEVQL